MFSCGATALRSTKIPWVHWPGAWLKAKATGADQDIMAVVHSLVPPAMPRQHMFLCLFFPPCGARSIMGDCLRAQTCWQRRLASLARRHSMRRWAHVLTPAETVMRGRHGKGCELAAASRWPPFLSRPGCPTSDRPLQMMPPAPFSPRSRRASGRARALRVGGRPRRMGVAVPHQERPRETWVWSSMRRRAEFASQGGRTIGPHAANRNPYLRVHCIQSA